MRIKSIEFLSDYSVFKKGQRFSFSGKKNILLLGENGSGKTTILSTISNLFYYLERYPQSSHKINFDVCINYAIEVGKEKHDIFLTYSRDGMRIKSDYLGERWIVPRKIANKRDNSFGPVGGTLTGMKLIEISDIKKFLPDTVAGSVFSTNDEYPINRPYNYLGELKNIVQNTSIESFFGTHHSSENLTRGILLVAKYHKTFQDVFDLKWNGQLLLFRIDEIKKNPGRFERRKTGKSGWEKHSVTSVIEMLANKDLYDELYVNDLQFKKANGETIHFQNMSAGEKFLFLRIISLVDKVSDKSLVLIEEPEMLLNPVWQEKYMSLINVFLKESQIMLSTHSPFLLNNSKDTEMYILKKSQNAKELGENLSLLDTSSINITSYQAFGIISSPLHIELFTLLQIKHGSLKNAEKFLLSQKNMPTKSHLASTSYPNVKKGKTITESLPLYIRNASHHPEETNRSFTKRQLEKSIKIMFGLLK